VYVRVSLAPVESAVKPTSTEIFGAGSWRVRLEPVVMEPGVSSQRKILPVSSWVGVLVNGMSECGLGVGMGWERERERTTYPVTAHSLGQTSFAFTVVVEARDNDLEGVVRAVAEERQEGRDVDLVLAEIEGVDADDGAPEAGDDAWGFVNTGIHVRA